MQGKTILLVEDEAAIVDVVRRYLERGGYRVVVASDGHRAVDEFRRLRPDLVLLDLMLPGLDGWEVCRRIRQEGSTPVIMLTARDDEADKLVGLELGADDYITKPFSPREVVARVRAVLRRVRGTEAVPGEVVRVEDLEIDPSRMEVSRGGTPLHLTPTEFRLLLTLARHPGRVFTRLQLLDQVQGYAYEGYERTIDAHIKNLRQKLEPDPRHPRYILTVHRVGYRFAGTSRG
ncbi:MAG: response regulator transcription factor [Armatimonadota bacterium]|nr:response regulator transcription factor [Armatimonadota bacterium]MDR7480388.1 response regulator transcription factor [Armatimonadota bacterium]MDR7502583.1 response regulator transcription factor [Armatimonadota bacterium]MDR7528303.1 response regulator transcription factor [Armatimonadota bacterium]MDR7584664.1 response regulator transcription factor [Armatimonadota bacterium]